MNANRAVGFSAGRVVMLLPALFELFFRLSLAIKHVMESERRTGIVLGRSGAGLALRPSRCRISGSAEDATGGTATGVFDLGSGDLHPALERGEVLGADVGSHRVVVRVAGPSELFDLVTGQLNHLDVL